VVMFLHRARLTDPTILAQDAELIVAKQRNGATGNVYLTYLPSYTKFENRAKDGED